MKNITWQQVEAALTTLQSVQGGFTSATRGIITLEDDTTAFVKVAVDDLTKKWLSQELRAYSWLAEQGFTHIPRLFAQSGTGLLMPDLSAWDWSENWPDSKIQHVFDVIENLASYGTKAKGMFDEIKVGFNAWPDIPRDVAAFEWLRSYVTEREMTELEVLLADEQTRAYYNELTAAEPWKGSDLMHCDVRGDNCAYNLETGEVLLIDWNWICIGNRKIDESAVFVNAAKAGADLNNFVDQFDPACLAAIAGIWLASMGQTLPEEDMIKLRIFQLQNALIAHKLIQLHDNR